MTSDDYYSRLKTLFGEEFKNFKGKNITILGCGGIGSFTAEFLARYGFNLHLVDFDLVEETNLSRQNFTFDDVGRPKTTSLKERIECVNPDVVVKESTIKFNSKNAENIVSGSDLVLDCFDNMDSKLLLNDICKKLNIPFIHMAAIERKGNILFVGNDGPCLSCLYENPTEKEDKCDIVGVSSNIPTLTGLISIDLIIDFFTGNKIENNLIRINLKTRDIRKLNLKKNKNCKTCNKNYRYLINNKNKKKYEIESLCEKNTFQVILNNCDSFKKKILNYKILNKNKHFLKSRTCFNGNNIVITFFNDGRCLIKGLSKMSSVKKYMETICGD